MDKKFTDEQYLNFIFDFCKNHEQEIKSYNANSRMHKHRGEQKGVHDVDADILYQYLVDLYEFNKFPKVVSNSEYINLPGRLIYRGYTDISHCANYLSDYDYHYGVGVFNSGTYFTDDEILAKQYTVKAMPNKFALGKANEDYVIKVKLDPMTRMAESDYLSQDVATALLMGSTEHFANMPDHDKKKLEEFIAFCNSLDTFDAEYLREIFRNDIAKLAVYLGYDGMYQDINSNCYIVFNRGKVVVSQKEYDRVNELAKIKAPESDYEVNY